MSKGTAKAYIDDGHIVISIPVADLPRIISDSVDYGYVAPGVKVTDVDRFAKDVVNALNHEKEDGTTRVHEMFDDGFERAIEDGSLGVKLLDTCQHVSGCDRKRLHESQYCRRHQ